LGGTECDTLVTEEIDESEGESDSEREFNVDAIAIVTAQFARPIEAQGIFFKESQCHVTCHNN